LVVLLFQHLKNFISSYWGAFFGAARAVTGRAAFISTLDGAKGGSGIGLKRGNEIVWERLCPDAVACDRAQAGFITHPAEQS